MRTVCFKNDKKQRTCFINKIDIRPEYYSCWFHAVPRPILRYISQELSVNQSNGILVLELVNRQFNSFKCELQVLQKYRCYRNIGEREIQVLQLTYKKTCQSSKANGIQSIILSYIFSLFFFFYRLFPLIFYRLFFYLFQYFIIRLFYLTHQGMNMPQMLTVLTNGFGLHY